jgi:hypothetical protein
LCSSRGLSATRLWRASHPAAMRNHLNPSQAPRPDSSHNQPVQAVTDNELDQRPEVRIVRWAQGDPDLPWTTRARHQRSELPEQSALRAVGIITNWISSTEKPPTDRRTAVPRVSRQILGTGWSLETNGWCILLSPETCARPSSVLARSAPAVCPPAVCPQWFTPSGLPEWSDPNGGATWLGFGSRGLTPAGDDVALRPLRHHEPAYPSEIRNRRRSQAGLAPA